MIDNITLIIIIIFFIFSMYSEIKFLCLKKACEKIAVAEAMSELTGEEKFALVTKWIVESLPLVFGNALFTNIIKKLIQYAYKNSFDYMKRYVKRKTGLDISELISACENNNTNTVKES